MGLRPEGEGAHTTATRNSFAMLRNPAPKCGFTKDRPPETDVQRPDAPQPCASTARLRARLRRPRRARVRGPALLVKICRSFVSGQQTVQLYVDVVQSKCWGHHHETSTRSRFTAYSA